MAELITEHRQGLEEERQARERERQEFEGRLERLTVGGGTNKEAELKRQLVRRETAVGELRKQVFQSIKYFEETIKQLNTRFLVIGQCLFVWRRGHEGQSQRRPQLEQRQEERRKRLRRLIFIKLGSTYFTLTFQVRSAKAAAEYAAVFWSEKYRKVAFLSSPNISHPLSFPAGGGGGSCEGAGTGVLLAGVQEEGGPVDGGGRGEEGGEDRRDWGDHGCYRGDAR